MQRVTMLRPLSARPADGHKGTFGRVLVVGGNATMIGAPAFCGLAAYHAGCGYVQLATPEVVLLHTLGLCPQAIGLAVPSPDFAAAVEKADAVAIGPGLGQIDAAKSLVRTVLAGGKPSVIDADALNLIAAGDEWPGGVTARGILTPHPGEMKRLGRLFGKTEQSAADEADRLDTARRAAGAFGQVIVLKGHRTIVCDGRRAYVNATGSTALAKAGSGDILSGIIAALAAQKNADPFDAAAAGVWVHGKAGEIAGRRVGERSCTSPDVIAAVGEALAEYGKHFGVDPDDGVPAP